MQTRATFFLKYRNLICADILFFLHSCLNHFLYKDIKLSYQILYFATALHVSLQKLLVTNEF